MPSPQKTPQDTFSYEDYQRWPDDERWEIIDGQAYNMSPAPSVKHQDICRNIVEALLGGKINKNKCRIYFAPTDVVLDDINIVQPDVFVVCDANIITEKNIQGAPDLIIEVVSPSTEIKDRREKKFLYEKFGVGEYLIVFPEREYLERYTLMNSTYGPPEIFNWDETLPMVTFPDFAINLWHIFEKNQDEKPESKPSPATQLSK
ncbi:MAG: Uma2 family endonuclease [Thermodesulfobacteriota bacterium]|nr:Uma2 family endonuclease [Thermodesulfobacteriota bacterium]